MIIIGYQGIGKSTLANVSNGCIDLESGNFWVDGNRSNDWYIAYCQIANHLSKQGYTVFVSSHESVQKELEKSDESVFMIYPSTELENKWVFKLAKRYAISHLDKDKKAYLNAKDNYENSVDNMAASPIPSYEIDDICYSLEDIVKILKEMSKWLY